ncbi:tRNA threonylcarbamoyladenosine biosynthesis protein TsaB [Amphibacillus marinus]|uniref:tRNA threonylcarbamoyladenosine biosynthesis protein TsaB n=1 Tax=Amphibacillus marinus TaxID=872970 RepID=A0A1H8KYW0_9BACI|nr:tRNA (adenosine(37)-N6)-threonylcarbamoyltransferase complex dimerization subunit type 1 TsaB [Amphibacillus marinus]SEN97746.1 tRNA threonylcarbamoyladenosine biosynthesis protein TsaB [Amphibacillus marinus]
MTILAIDTSNEMMGLALYHDQKIIAEYVSSNKNQHSTRLMPAINQIMADAHLKPKELTKIVVAKGPGSYTGVRIGLSVAKTMAWSLQIPIVGLSSLQALAYSAKPYQTMICPFFDARRGLVYTGLYNQHGKVVMTDQNLLMTDWLAQLKKDEQKCVFISPDIAVYQEQIIEVLGDQALFADSGFNYARPSMLAFAGADMGAQSVHELVPNYIRLVEAEVKWLEARRNQGNA